MKTESIVSNYHNSILKKVFNLTTSLLGLIISFPFCIILSLLIKTTSEGSIFFKQKRVGKSGKVFTLIKFRTMRVGAEKERGGKWLERQNVSDGPTFKIPKDPRYTGFGKYLVKTGLDELPQLINVLRGEMAIVGPRPLPVYEATYLTKKQKVRELVLPGIVSSWVVSGAHNLKFKEWMKLDEDYVKNGFLLTDIIIIVKTAILLTKLTLKKLTKPFVAIIS